MEAYQIIDALESTPGTNDKIEILKNNVGNAEFRSGLVRALNSYITYGIKKVPISEVDGPGLDFSEFEVLLDKLSARTLTGNAAIAEVNRMMERATKQQWNSWYRRILIKDLRCGVSVKTVNKVVRKLIPVFNTQLAHSVEDHHMKMVGRKMVEVKLDGVRVITIVHPNGKVEMYSRNGKELLNFSDISNQFSSIAHMLDEPIVLDGEIMSESFQDLMKQIHRKADVDTTGSVLHLFDVLNLTEFMFGQSEFSQIVRNELLHAFYNDTKEYLPNVRVLDHEIVNLSSKEGKKRFEEINKTAIENGFEGIMIKDLNAKYECKRTASWLKMKPVITVSLQIVSVEEGTGKNSGMLGNFICEGIDEGRNIKSSVGGGLTDKQRQEFWDHKEELIGKVIEVKADAFTKSESNDYWSLRFPRFECFRDDKEEL